MSRRVTAASLSDRVAELVRLADDLCAMTGISREAVTQTVVGSPGIYDPQRNVMALTGGLPEWDHPEALAGLREAFGPALAIENDVDAASLAERAHGHGRDVDDFAFVHVGTGIGMGVVLGGRLHRGVHGVAGEIAFMPIGGGWEDDLEEARRRGGLETLAGADGVVRAALRAGMPALSAQAVFEAAERGDERAAQVVAREARLVAYAICCVITVVDPSLIVLGGGIGRAPGFAATVTEELRLMAPVLPEVRVSALGTDVVVDGCLAEGTSLAWGQLVSGLPTPALP
jgi:predicted NBD/HSP70 family sugar kinase